MVLTKGRSVSRRALGLAAVAGLIAFLAGCPGSLMENPVAFPQWQEQGPFAVHNGQTGGLSNNAVIGAINAIAPHPDNANVLYVGSVNGGIWRTDNAQSAFPDWTPQSDDLESGSISAIVFDPLDSSHLSLYASLGSRSSYGVAGPMLGVVRTFDGGDSWEHAPSAGLVGFSVRDLVALPMSVDKAPILLAATSSGVFRSEDGGDTFTRTWPPAGVGGAFNITSLVRDSGDPATAYAATITPPSGFEFARSVDSGLTWTPIEHQHEVINRVEVRLAVGPGSPGKPGPIYKAFASGRITDSDGSSVPDSRVWVYRSEDRGDSWQSMFMPLVAGDEAPGPHPGGQTNRHFSLAADARAVNRVFVGGDRNPAGTGTGATHATGRLFRGTFGAPAGNIWQPIVGDSVNGTSPHADSRRMAFDAAGNLLEVDDGGIYRLSAPDYRRWQSLNGNLRITEFFSIAWDAHSNVLLGGTQDNGVVEQQAPWPAGASTPWRMGRLFSVLGATLFSQVGDGGYVAVDARSFDSHATRFSLGNNEHVFISRNFGNANDDVFPTWLTLLVDAPAAPSPVPFSGLLGPDADLDYSGLRRVPFDLNNLSGQRLAIGISNLYVSDNGGASIDLVNPPATDSAVAARRIDTLEYGGYSASGAPAPDALVWARGNMLFERGSVGGPISSRLVSGDTFNTRGLAIRDIEFDPDDWRTVYLNNSLEVWRIRGLGTDEEVAEQLTGNLASIDEGYMDRSAGSKGIVLTRLELVPVKEQLCVVVSGMGGVYRLQRAREADPANSSQWLRFGRGLPPVQVMDVDYDATDDVLAIGTAGRGAWMITDAAEALAAPLLIPADETE